MNERIKELRTELGLTMEKFGKRLGVKKNTVSQWENGTNSLTEQMLKSICREFNVSENWLRTGNEDGGMFNPAASTELEELAGKYGLTSKDYVFIEKLMKNKELLSSFEDFCLDYASGLMAQGHGREPSIDEQVKDYRRQLEAEKKAAGESSALRKDA